MVEAQVLAAQRDALEGRRPEARERATSVSLSATGHCAGAATAGASLSDSGETLYEPASG